MNPSNGDLAEINIANPWFFPQTANGGLLNLAFPLVQKDGFSQQSCQEVAELVMSVMLQQGHKTPTHMAKILARGWVCRRLGSWQCDVSSQ